MNAIQAAKALAAPPPEPFKQVRVHDWRSWDRWNERRIEALRWVRDNA